MKILRLNLVAFGPFTDRLLEFGGEPGLRIVYGPNEAGKSSTLRALRDLLYGIPNNTNDDFVHTKPNLRLGATIEHSSGECLSFVRRKGNTKTLLNGDGATPIDDDALLPFLGGFDRAAFEQMFGIDHAALVQGGGELVRLQGDAGKILFAAAGGITHLPEVQARLKEEADALFLAGGRKPRINATLSELDDAKKTMRKAHVPVKEWEEQDKRRLEAIERIEKLAKSLQAKREEQTRLSRLASAIPAAVKHRGVLEELRALGEVRLVPEEFSQSRISTLTELTRAQNAATHANERLKKLAEEMQSLAVPQAILDRNEAFVGLPERLGSYRKAQRDLPGLIAQRDQSLEQAGEILRELRPDLTLDAIDPLRLSKRQQIEIQNLGHQQAGLAKEVETTRKRVQEKEALRQHVEAELAEMAPTRDVTALRSAVEYARGRGPSEEDLATLERDKAQIEQQLKGDLSRLPGWSGSLEMLEGLAVPSPESIEVFDEELRGAADHLKQVTARIAEVNKALAEGTTRSEKMRLEQGQAPTEEDLLAARQLREQGWQLVLRQARGEGVNQAEAARFIAAVQRDVDLTVAFELSVRRADEVADRLRHEADRVAARANLEAEQRARELELSRLGDKLSSAEQCQSAAVERWRSVWRPLGIVPLSPKEMRSWVTRQQALVWQCQEFRRKQAEADALQEQIRRSRSEISQCLCELGEPSAGETESLEAIVGRAADYLQRAVEAARQRTALESSSRKLAAELKLATAEAASACEKLCQWEANWKAAIEPLGLPPAAMPSQASEVLQNWKELFDKCDAATAFAKRIKDIGLDSQRFEAEVESLSQDVGVVRSNLAIDRLAEKLIADWRQAGEDRARRELLIKQHHDRSEELEQAKQAIEHQTQALAAMCQQAGCTEPEQLSEIEQRSTACRQLQQEKKQLEENLFQWTGGIELGQFLAALKDENVDELQTRMATLASEIEGIEEQVRQASAERGAAEESLNQLGRGTEAVEAAEKAQSLLARLREDSLEFARLKLASAVLRETIERFRKKNEGPIVERAGRHFAQITCGRFAGLQVDYDPNGEPLLVGVQADGRVLRVEGMSEGTADQLYLALRLASLETYFQHQEPLPFIVDDILIKFDDQRSVATLKALAQLARQTQVIVFTHHAHLVELARRNLRAEELSVQDLGA